MRSHLWTNKAYSLRNNNFLSPKSSSSINKPLEGSSNSILRHSLINRLLLPRHHLPNKLRRSNSHHSNSNSLSSLVSLSLSTSSNSSRRKAIAFLKATHSGLFLNRALNKTIQTCSADLTCLKRSYSQTCNSRTCKTNSGHSNLRRSRKRRVALKDYLISTRWSRNRLILLRKTKRRRHSNKTHRTSCMSDLMRLLMLCLRAWVDLIWIMPSIKDKEIKDFSSVQQVSWVHQRSNNSQRSRHRSRQVSNLSLELTKTNSSEASSNNSNKCLVKCSLTSPSLVSALCED